MATEKYSWTKAIGEAREQLSLSAGRALLMLRQGLGIHPLKGFELEMLGRFLREMPVGEVAEFPLRRVAIASGYTSAPLANVVRVALLAEGFRTEIYEAPFGAYRQEILASDSGLYAFDPDLVLLVPSVFDISGMPAGPASDGDVEKALASEVGQWRMLWGELSGRSRAIILQHNFDSPDSAFLGVADRRSSWSPASFIAALNGRMIDAAPTAVCWVDVDNLAAMVGRQNWRDPRLAYHGKFGFSPTFLPEYAALLGGVLRPVLGKPRKALVLDLDNTLWGGVIGDDGLEGIRLGPDTPEGEAFQAFCRYVHGLGSRGIILGICSKNEMANVVEVFERHRHMPLSLADFVAVRCNWEDKASNLSAMAQELNIDVSAMVFVDDNPAECELVRQALPSVCVVQLPDDPALFVRHLERRHLFDSQVYSAEDIGRTESYRARTKAAELQSAAPDIETYLRSLEMRGKVWRAGGEDIPRLAQMEAKTNQFNLTTRRWTPDQLEQFAASRDHDVFCFRLADRFVDHGLVGSMVVSYSGTEARILSWLLSCRVFSRTCEEFMLAAALGQARERGMVRVTGEFIATEKNKVVATLFPRLGFVPTGTDGIFALEMADASLPHSFISPETRE